MIKTKKVWLGILFLSIYNILSAAKDVIVGNKTQSLNVFLIMSSVFMVGACIFIIINFIAKNKSSKKSISLSPLEIIQLNAVTAGTWFGFYLSIKTMEPAIVAGILGGLNPILTILINKKMRPGTVLHWSDWISSIGILILCAFLILLHLNGASAISNNVENLELGLIYLAISALSLSYYTVFSKKLYDKNIETHTIMASRFYLVIAIGIILGGGLLAFKTFFYDNFTLLILLSLLGVVCSLYFLQEGIKRCEVVLVEMVLAISPIFTLLLQSFDSRLDLKLGSIIGVVGIVFFVALNAFYQFKSESKVSNA